MNAWAPDSPVLTSGSGPLQADYRRSFHLSKPEQKDELQSGAGHLQTVDDGQDHRLSHKLLSTSNRVTWSHRPLVLFGSPLF